MSHFKFKWAILALVPLGVIVAAMNLNSWRPRRERVMGTPIQVAFSPNGNYVALATQSNGGEAGRIEVWKVGAPSWYRQPSTEVLLAGAVDDPRSICFSSDSKMLLCTRPGGMNRWNLAARKAIKPLSQSWGQGDGRYAQMWPHSDVLTASTYDGWQGQNVRGGVPQSHKMNREPNYPIDVLAFAPDGRTVAWHSDDGTDSDDVFLRDTRTKRSHHLPSSKVPHAKENKVCYVNSLTFSPDSRFLAVGLRNETISRTASQTWAGTKLWDVRTLKLSVQWGEDSKTINAHAFSPDGSLIASARADGAISLRETGSGKLLRLFKPPSTNVSSVAFSPDGRTLASCGSDNALYLWRIK